MPKIEDRAEATLKQISDLINAGGKGCADDMLNEIGSLVSGRGRAAASIGCTIRRLPKEILVNAASTAIKVNPLNAPATVPQGGIDVDIATSLRAAVVTTKYWGNLGEKPRRLTVSFLDSPPSNLRDRILLHMNAWRCGISFAWTQGVGAVRIAREIDGYWSYLGTDILHIAKDQPTMNLQEFTMATDEEEYKRVVRHETGHTLGMPHEHMRKELVGRIDKIKAYKYFLDRAGWNKRTVDQQVLTPLDEKTIFGTPADETSIMCYHLPGDITIDGAPILGGSDINESDYAFAATAYPKRDSDLTAELALGRERGVAMGSKFLVEPLKLDA